MSTYEAILKRVENLEREIDRLRYLILLRSRTPVEMQMVSLRGMAKPLVPISELEKSIEEAKPALFIV